MIRKVGFRHSNPWVNWTEDQLKRNIHENIIKRFKNKHNDRKKLCKEKHQTFFMILPRFCIIRCLSYSQFLKKLSLENLQLNTFNRQMKGNSMSQENSPVKNGWSLVIAQFHSVYRVFTHFSASKENENNCL